MDAVVLSQILEQLKRTGKSTDVAGTSTLFARLAQIAAYVDTLESQIGLATDPGATSSTLHGRANLIYGAVDTLESSVGQLGDGADTNGTVHGKLRDIRNKMDGGVIASPIRSMQVATFGLNLASGSPRETIGSGDVAYFDIGIAWVNTAKTVVHVNGTTNVSSQGSNIFARLINSTTVRVYATYVGTWVYGVVQVVEHN